MFKAGKLAVVVILATIGASTVAESPALAYSGCERYANTPSFSGNAISGKVYTVCSRLVPTATLHGRIKEDRNNLPDIVHDHESGTFQDDYTFWVETSTCQDNDKIYTEAQINSETPAQSSSATMQC